MNWYKRKDKPVGKMRPGADRNENTYMGHWFVARTAKGGLLVDWLQIQSTSGVWNIEPHQCEEEEQCTQEFLEEKFYWEARNYALGRRDSLNYVQPKVVRGLTRVGYKKLRMPENLYKEVYEFWQKKRHTDSVKEETGGEVFNQRDVPMWMLHLRQRERILLTEGIRPLLEEWSGVKLPRMTSLYGIRWYTRGALMKLHVDTVNTHVVSAIINVDQEEMEEDWTLEVHGHDGKVNFIPMAPGDIVFYESAKVLHTRHGPLEGKTYANIFIHFAPDQSDWDYSWW